MQVLVLDSDDVAQDAVRKRLMRKGLQVTRAQTVEQAMAAVRNVKIDLLVLRHRIDGRGTLSVALAAEYHNPDVATVLLSNTEGHDADELFDLVPSMSCLLGSQTAPDLVAKCALSALKSRKPVPMILENPVKPVFASTRTAEMALMKAFRETAQQTV